MPKIYFLLFVLFAYSCANEKNENTSDSTIESSKINTADAIAKKQVDASTTFANLSLEEKEVFAKNFLESKGEMAQKVLRINLKMRLFLYSKSGRVDDILFKQKGGDLTKKNNFVKNSSIVDVDKGLYSCEGVYTLLKGNKKISKNYKINYTFTGDDKDFNPEIILK